jgi:hypothetical protein
LLPYRASIPGLSDAHLTFLSQLIEGHRAQIGCRWRKLDASAQALLVLAHLRCGDTLAQLAVGFEVSAVTVYRYVAEAVELLAAHAPNLAEVLANRQDAPVTVLDGTIIATQRVRATAEHKRWWVHRKKTYGINLQALADERGNLLWLSAGLPGATHDLTAARTHDIVVLAGRHRVTLFADKGYIGAGPGVITPIRAPKGRDLIPALKGYNRRHARRRAPGERGFATLKAWRILNKIRCTVAKVGAIAQAILVLHLATSTNIRLK